MTFPSKEHRIVVISTLANDVVVQITTLLLRCEASPAALERIMAHKSRVVSILWHIASQDNWGDSYELCIFF